MKKLLLTFLSILIISFVFSDILDKSTLIQNLEKTVYSLSKEEFKGRLSGTNGNSLSEEYLYNSLKEIGYDVNLFTFELDVIKYNKTPIMKYGGKNFDYVYDFDIKVQPGISFNGETNSEVFLLENIEDLNEHFQNKILIVKRELFENISQNSMYMQKLFNPDSNVSGLFISTDTGFGEYPKMVGVFNSFYSNKGPFLGSISNKTYDYIKNNPGEKLYIKSFATIEKMKSNNIYVHINNNAEKTLIFGAHYDGQGYIPKTYPGAYDNASGVSIVLELSKLFKNNNKYNFMFIFFSGEEQYMVGSQKFLQKMNFDVNNTYYINFDSLGINNINPINIESINGGNKSLRNKMYIKSKKYNFETKLEEVSGGDAQAFSDSGITSVQIIQPSTGIMHTLKDTPENINYEILYNITVFIHDFFKDF